MYGRALSTVVSSVAGECQIVEHRSNDVARFALECCPVMTSSFPRGPCFTLTGNDVIDAVYYLTAAIKLATLLCGPLLLAWMLVPRAAGRVDYVVPLTQSLRKTIYVKRVKTTGSEHQRHADPATRQFARFRQLVKNIPSEQIVDVSYTSYLYTFSASDCVFCNKIIRYDTIEEFSLDSKAEYSALSSTRSQKRN